MRLPVIFTIVWIAALQSVAASLSANFGDSETPLRLKEHQVTTVIEGGLAVTTIEQVFENPAERAVEGIYRYALSDSAVLTGFSMSIGGEMVEADVVETKRGQRIFGSYLQTARDPGLTEREAGNIFRTRIFPIFPAEQKRVRLLYVEPLAENLRYTYPVPWRALEDGQCQHAELEIRSGGESLKTEWLLGREEVVFQHRPQSRPVVTEFRDGDDGFVLIQPQPQTRPAVSRAALKRVLVLADTSGSMDAPKRRKQARFIEQLLSFAGESCVFSLAVCDAGARWVWDDEQPANEANIDAALAFLSETISLGWSDLGSAFASALKRHKDAEVIYVGDGIGIGFERTELGDLPNTQRLHAILTGPGVDSAAMGSLGGVCFEISATDDTLGRFLRLRGGETVLPAKIEFRDVKNLKLYRQGNLGFARYSASDSAAVEVGGESYPPGKSVASSSAVAQLWLAAHARERLKQQLTTQQRDEIVALSERWHVTTPLTSFLVLENDDERRRFGIRARAPAQTQWNLRATQWLDSMRYHIETRLTELESELPISLAFGRVDGDVWIADSNEPGYPTHHRFWRPNVSAESFPRERSWDNRDPLADNRMLLKADNTLITWQRGIDDNGILRQSSTSRARCEALRAMAASSPWSESHGSAARFPVRNFVRTHFNRLAGYGQFLKPRPYRPDGSEPFEDSHYPTRGSDFLSRHAEIEAPKLDLGFHADKRRLYRQLPRLIPNGRAIEVEITAQNDTGTLLLEQGRWTLTAPDGTVEWCDDAERGIARPLWGVGGVRDADPELYAELDQTVDFSALKLAELFAKPDRTSLDLEVATEAGRFRFRRRVIPAAEAAQFRAVMMALAGGCLMIRYPLPVIETALSADNPTLEDHLVAAGYWHKRDADRQRPHLEAVLGETPDPRTRAWIRLNLTTGSSRERAAFDWAQALAAHPKEGDWKLALETLCRSSGRIDFVRDVDRMDLVKDKAGLIEALQPCLARAADSTEAQKCWSAAVAAFLGRRSEPKSEVAFAAGTPLPKLAEDFLRGENPEQFRRFFSHAESWPLVRELARRLKTGAGQARVTNLTRLVEILSDRGGLISESDWRELADLLEQRWDEAREPGIEILARRIRSAILPDQAGYVDFSRKVGDAETHFAVMIQQPWSAEAEDELFGLASRLDVRALEDAARWSLWERVWRDCKEIEDVDDLIRKAIAETLAMLETRGDSEALRLIRLHLRHRIGETPPGELLDACVGLLGRPAVARIEDSRKAWELRDRALDMATVLAERAGPDSPSTERFIQTLDRWIELNPNDRGLREHLYAYLVVSHREDVLDARLESWIQTDPDPDPWRVIVGFRRLANGDFAGAVEVLETVADLTAYQLAAMADAYGGLGNGPKRNEALDLSALALDEGQAWSYAWLVATDAARSGGEMRMPDQVERILRLGLLKHSSPILSRLYERFREPRLLNLLVSDLRGRDSDSMLRWMHEFVRLLKKQIPDAEDLRQLDEIARQELARTDYELEATALRMVRLLLAHHASNARPEQAEQLLARLNAHQRQDWRELLEDFGVVPQQAEMKPEREPIPLEVRKLTHNEWQRFAQDYLGKNVDGFGTMFADSRSVAEAEPKQQAKIEEIVWTNFDYALGERETGRIWDSNVEASLARAEPLLRQSPVLTYRALRGDGGGAFRDLAFEILFERRDWNVIPDREQANLLSRLKRPTLECLTANLMLAHRNPTSGNVSRLTTVAANAEIPDVYSRLILREFDLRAPEHRSLLAKLALKRGFIGEAKSRLAESGDLRELAVLALLLGDQPEAVRLFLDAVELETWIANRRPIELFEAAGDLAALAAEITRRIRDRGSPSVLRKIHQRLAEEFAERENWDLAMGQAEQGFGKPSLGLAQLLRRAGKAVESREVVLQFLAAERLSAWDERFTEAIELLDKLGGESEWRAKTHAVEVNPRDRESYRAVWLSGKPRRQLEALNHYVAWEPDDPNWLLEKLDLLVGIPDKAAAGEVLKQIEAGTWHPRFGNVTANARLRRIQHD